jgi:acyl-homoserine-lactone acylase
VANSNNPPRYANPDHPLKSLEDVFGKPDVPLSLRARLGLQLIDERHGGRDGLGAREFTLDNIQTMFIGTRVHAAELVLDGLLAACRSTPSVDSGMACASTWRWPAPCSPAGTGVTGWTAAAATSSESSSAKGNSSSRMPWRPHSR